VIIAFNWFFILVFSVLLLTGCGDDSDPQTPKPSEEVEQEFNQFSLVQAREGKVKWKLNANTATFLESDQIKIEGVELRIFGDEEGEVLTIHGDYGEVDQRSDDIKIMGKVEGVSSDGGRLTADEVYWSDRNSKIYTLPGVKVTISYEDSVIVGEELEADPELESASMKDITGITKKEDGNRKAENRERKNSE
jgi:LPS export ABC transporter protein LptC